MASRNKTFPALMNSCALILEAFCNCFSNSPIELHPRCMDVSFGFARKVFTVREKKKISCIKHLPFKTETEES